MPERGEIDVAHVARLARLNLTEEETKTFQEQLGRVLEYAEKLREPTRQVETAAHARQFSKSCARTKRVHGSPRKKRCVTRRAR